ncbi:energy transducer TonB [Caulobacter sp. 602-1]|uniref:energy transducer TonB family protein n=1 Tax=Caulobacter sp. 602-1 TaxID=2492472 RepID=UPI000F630FBE|nr:energy transducer TonB [Caulobacter sp. 602-1]RRN62607.1 energy transducer TonB [Caulobacter sp. 602-1]
MSTASPPPPAGTIIHRPDWLVKPSGEDLAEFYPARAARRDISGRATIRCDVMADGRLDGCMVLEESPTDEHFGDAALKMASKFQMTKPDPNGPPASVTIPLVFRPPEPHAMIRPDKETMQSMMGAAAGVAAIALTLLLVLIWGLDRYNTPAAERRPKGEP